MIGTHLKTNEFRFPKHDPQIWAKSTKQFFKNGRNYRIREKPSEFIEVENLKIQLENKLIAELPLRFYEIYLEIENSKYLLSLDDDWDDEGSTGYKAATWKRAIQFVVNYATWVLDETSRV
ncbi:MAG: hypothetical protein ACE5HI_10225, partial [bacterium]